MTLEMRASLEYRPYGDFDYPLLLDTAKAGRWTTSADEFIVEELPLYPFSGEGEHAALVVEKRGIATRDLAKQVGSRLGVGPAAVGYAGMKDKEAICVQAFTVTGAETELAAKAFEEEGARVISSSRHGNKLRLGHLSGNRFRIFLHGGDSNAASEALSKLEALGVPNYFGPQRFGRGGDNALAGLRLLKGRGKAGRWKRDLLVSALQSFIFNEVLARRIEEGLYLKALEGDVMKKVDSGGVFTCEDVESEQKRVDQYEISPTGPLNGKKMVEPKGAAADFEARVLAALGLEAGLFSKQTGTRRPLRVPLAEPGVEEGEGGIWLGFVCPPGTYATSVIREIAQSGVFRVAD